MKKKKKKENEVKPKPTQVPQKDEPQEVAHDVTLNDTTILTNEIADQNIPTYSDLSKISSQKADNSDKDITENKEEIPIEEPLVLKKDLKVEVKNTKKVSLEDVYQESQG